MGSWMPRVEGSGPTSTVSPRLLKSNCLLEVHCSDEDNWIRFQCEGDRNVQQRDDRTRVFSTSLHYGKYRREWNAPWFEKLQVMRISSKSSKNLYRNKAHLASSYSHLSDLALLPLRMKSNFIKIPAPLNPPSLNSAEIGLKQKVKRATTIWPRFLLEPKDFHI